MISATLAYVLSTYRHFYAFCLFFQRIIIIRKEAKYADLPASFSFQPVAVETLGPINDSAIDFLRELGRMISANVQDERHIALLFQRLSVTVQHFNSIILHDSFSPGSDLWPFE